MPPPVGSGHPSEGLAARLRGFGPVGLIAILAILAGNLLVVPLSALLVLLWARWSGTAWQDIGYVRPRNWLGSFVIGSGLGVAFKFLMKSIVMPLFGADPINRPYHFLAGNRAAIPGMLFLLIVGAGFGEETVFRGFLFERFRKLLGHSVAARAVAVLATTALFAAAHYPDQGIAGVEQAAMTGLAFGTVFAITGRLWALMCAHAAFDLAAYAMIYWNLEPQVAHLVFR